MRFKPLEGTYEMKKRTYFPLIVHEDCPKCGTESSSNLSMSYISYAKIGANGINNVTIFCKPCDQYFAVPVTIHISLESAGPPIVSG